MATQDVSRMREELGRVEIVVIEEGNDRGKRGSNPGILRRGTAPTHRVTLQFYPLPELSAERRLVHRGYGGVVHVIRQRRSRVRGRVNNSRTHEVQRRDLRKRPTRLGLCRIVEPCRILRPWTRVTG
jgi:hypothetical protein